MHECDTEEVEDVQLMKSFHLQVGSHQSARSRPQRSALSRCSRIDDTEQRVEASRINAVIALPQAVIRAAAELLGGEHSIILAFRNREVGRRTAPRKVHSD